MKCVLNSLLNEMCTEFSCQIHVFYPLNIVSNSVSIRLYLLYNL